MSYLHKVTDNAFKKMPLLKILECRGCYVIKDKGLSKLIEGCPNLELIDLSACHKVSNKFIIAAIQATKIRTNGVVCKVYVGNTAVRMQQIKNNSPLLQIENRDLSDSDRPFYGGEFGDMGIFNNFGLPDDMDIFDIDDPIALWQMSKDYDEVGDIFSASMCRMALDDIYN